MVQDVDRNVGKLNIMASANTKRERNENENDAESA